MINKIVLFLKNKDVPCWSFNNRQLKTLLNTFPKKEIINCEDLPSFLEELKTADLAVIWTFKDEWLKKAKNLKIIITPAAGKDFFQINTNKNILLDYSSFHGQIMAESVIGMILAQSRGIIKSYELQNSIQWPRKEIATFAKSLKTSTVCIVGFGNIGIKIAKLLKAFGTKIIAIKRSLIERPVFMDKEDIIDTIENLDKYLTKIDHLVLCVPRNKSTDNIINEKLLRTLPEHSVIYNVGRGNAINEEDLTFALKNKIIAAAYLDVFKEEPLKMNSELRKLKNCIIMPHSSAISPEYLDLFLEEFIEKIVKWDKQY